MSRHAGRVTGLVDRLDAVNYGKLRTRIDEALRRASAGDVRRDGYPVGVRVAGVPLGSGVRSTSSTERSVLAAIDSEARDPVRHHALAAARAIADAVDALARCESALTMVEKLGGRVPLDAELRCEECDLAGVHGDSHERTDVAGALHRPMRLCKDHVLFVERFRHLPSIEQTRHHHRYGKWMVAAEAV